MALDILWVLRTPAKVSEYTTGGKGLFAGIAIVVGTLAGLQIRALFGLLRESGNQIGAGAS